MLSTEPWGYIRAWQSNNMFEDSTDFFHVPTLQTDLKSPSNKWQRPSQSAILDNQNKCSVPESCTTTGDS